MAVLCCKRHNKIMRLVCTECIASSDASLLAAATGALDALVTTDRTAAYDYDTPNQRLNSFYTLIYGKNTRAIKQLRAAIKKAKGE